MEAFGVRFTVNNPQRFQALRSLFAEVKRDKEARHFRNPEEWVRLIPDDVRARFSWPTSEEREHWVALREFSVVAIPSPSELLGAEWDFYRIFETMEMGEYGLLGCEMVGEGVAEMRIDPFSYPYGGVGPFIALAEAFGFIILGVNEYGKYQSREELLGGGGPAGPPRA